MLKIIYLEANYYYSGFNKVSPHINHRVWTALAGITMPMVLLIRPEDE